MNSPYFLIVLVIVVVAMFWFSNRTQRRNRQQRQEQLNSMKKGDKITTIGGLHGVIESVSETTIDINCEGVILTFEKSAVRPVVAMPSAVAPTSSAAETPSSSADVESSSSSEA